MRELVNKISNKYGLDYKTILAFIQTETGGKGFIDNKIVIQFEPHHFKKRANLSTFGEWANNKVDVQSKEWEAFNNAFKINPNAAMESTSIGLGQIMGFHWKRLGFKSVGEMWDFSKVDLSNQIELIVRFINTDTSLLKAVRDKNWHVIAQLYNGSGYQELARRLGREPYNVTMEKFYNKL